MWNQTKCTVVSIHFVIWSAVFGKFSNPSEQTKSVAKICIKEQKCSKNLYQTQNTKANQLVWNQSWILMQTKCLFVYQIHLYFFIQYSKFTGAKNLYQTQNTKANQLVWNQSWILMQTKCLFVYQIHLYFFIQYSKFTGAKNLYQTQNTKANQLVWNQSWILMQTKCLFVYQIHLYFFIQYSKFTGATHSNAIQR